jgi:hypothetical protein
VVLWIASQLPFPSFDGIGDRKERMRRLWKDVEEQCERINAEMRRRRGGLIEEPMVERTPRAPVLDSLNGLTNDIATGSLDSRA